VFLPEGVADGKAPTIKKINDRDLQWNPATQTWDPPGVTGSVESVENHNRQAREITTLVTDLLDIDPKKVDRFIGPKASRVPRILWSEEKVDFVNKAERLKNFMTLENLSLMTGVLTDKDIELLSSAATELSLEGSLSAFTSELNKISGELGTAPEPPPTIGAITAPEDTKPSAPDYAPPAGEIWVVDKNGGVGSLPIDEFNSNEYEKL
jgi:hypothetical protein